MRVALINMSPKLIMKKTVLPASHQLLQIAKRYLRRNHVHDMSELHFKNGAPGEADILELFRCDVWLFAFPIYSGGIPAHMMQMLEQIRDISDMFMERGIPDGMEKPVRVYAMANGGLYDGSEAEPAFEILEHWCEECGFSWGAGLGIGGGPSFSYPHVLGYLSRKQHRFYHEITSFSAAIAGEEQAASAYTSPSVTKLNYVRKINSLIRRKSRDEKRQ